MKRMVIYYALFILTWIGAWLLYFTIGLETESSEIKFLYWTFAKLLIWILPVFLITKFVFKENIARYLGFKNYSIGIKQGAICGLIFIGLSSIIDIFMKSYTWPAMTVGFLNTLFIAPLFEEIVFRGFILESLQKTEKNFWKANSVAAFMFFGTHLPGWYLMGSLTPLPSILIVSILLIGLIGGYIKEKSNSLWSSIVFHFINNLYSSFIR